MQLIEHQFSQKKVSYYFDSSFSDLEKSFQLVNTIIITDETIYSFYKEALSKWKTIIIPAGEAHKQQNTVDSIITQLISLNADRNTTLIGFGGGVVTDITGYIASIYLRGVPFAFVPTTILAMVDAAIGGKNGIDIGAYKNLVGTINQPKSIYFDYSLLNTLPSLQWSNGFAEIIKHACINEIALFNLLKENKLEDFQNGKALLAEIIERNVSIKTKIVIGDEFETGDRKLLNFGHTFGHAIENTYNLLHGQAVSVGMVMALHLSHKLGYLPLEDISKIKALLKKYGLITEVDYDKNIIWKYLSMDKKRVQDDVNFILLKNIGEGFIHKINIIELKKLVDEFFQKFK